MFYVSNRRCKPNETDPKQYGLVKEFHDSLKDKKVYRGLYDSLPKFRRRLVRDLKEKVEELEEEEEKRKKELEKRKKELEKESISDCPFAEKTS